MDLTEKIDLILKENGLKTRKELANKISLEYNIFNRNVKKNNLTGDMIKAFVNSDIKFDVTRLIKDDNVNMVNEPEEIYDVNPLDKLQKAINLIEEVKLNLSRR